MDIKPGWTMGIYYNNRDGKIIDRIDIRDEKNVPVCTVVPDTTVSGAYATIYEAVSPEGVARARVLLAVPEMLHALLAARDWLSYERNDCPALRTIETALAKATGVPPKES
jgi:hypothetical protein